MHRAELHDRPVTQHYAFRPAGRSAGVDEISDIAAVDRNVGRRRGTRCQDRLVVLGRMRHAADTDRHAQGRDGAEQLARHLFELSVEDQNRRFAIPADLGQFLRREPMVHVDNDQVRAFAGGEDLEILDTVRRTATRSCRMSPRARRRVAKPEGARGELRIRAAAVLEHDKQAIAGLRIKLGVA